MKTAFKLRRATGDQVRLPNATGEWQLRFRDSAARAFANARLSRERWLGINDEEELLYTFIHDQANHFGVLQELIAAGIPEREIDAPKPWHGTEEQQAMLASKNYQKGTDRNGDVYYGHGLLPIIWLFTDGTWQCEKGSAHSTLEEHLNHVTVF